MRRKWGPIGGLLLLSLLWAAGWLRADLAPGAAASGLKLSPLASQAALLGVFAALAAIAAAIRKKRWPERMILVKAMLVGVGLFVVPALVAVLVQRQMDDTARVALFSLTPLFAVIFEPYLVDQANEIRSGFAAALVAVAGTFLVFPFGLPNSYASAAALLGVLVSAASIAATNCLGVEIVQGRGLCPATFAAVSAGFASIALGVAALTHIGGESSSATLGAWTLAEVIALALLFWLMKRMSATRMTTRFLIAPLLANLISLALLRPYVEIQSWIGLLLIAAGAGWMLLAPVDANAATGDALGLN